MPNKRILGNIGVCFFTLLICWKLQQIALSQFAWVAEFLLVVAGMKIFSTSLTMVYSDREDCEVSVADAWLSSFLGGVYFALAAAIAFISGLV